MDTETKNEFLRQKRVLVMEDLSCLGKCSLSTALPVLSALGLEAVGVPTAVLSTHTQFADVHFRDLTEDLRPIRDRFLREGFVFDAVYTGYLGSIAQAQIAEEYFRSFAAEGTLRIADPAMADDGKLYRGFDDAFVEKMRELCASADIILPNLSEAALLSGKPYPGEEASEEEIRELLLSLSDLGCGICVITGVTLADGKLGFMAFDKKSKEFSSYGNEKIPFRSHGTGDLFAATFAGAYTLGKGLPEALRIAADYTAECIRITYEDPQRCGYGVRFETALPYLMKRAGIL